MRKKQIVLLSLILVLNYFLVGDDRDGQKSLKEPFSREVKNTWGGKQMKKNIMRPILCFLVVSAFLMPLMGTTALGDRATYYFNSHDDSDPAEVWTTNPGYMVDGNENTYASTQSDGDVELLTGNTCPGGGTLVTKVELRVKGYYFIGESARDIILIPVFPAGDGLEYTFDAPAGVTEGEWSEWFNITSDPNAPTWSLNAVAALDCDVKASSGSGSFTLFCSKVEIRVT